MAPTNRWYPVLLRYISYVAGRVDGLGGASNTILPSPSGVPPQQIFGPTEHVYTGKVCEVIFDCSGRCEGFALDDCKATHTFETRDRDIAELALQACKERLLLSLYVESESKDRICKLVVR
jgi:hypothetical protein